MKYLLIGSGPAAIFAAEAIRERDPKGSITMISADDDLAQSPVMLTYWLTGKLPLERLFFRDPSWPERKRVDFLPGQRVISLDTALRKVALANARDIPYDRLLIATGSTPIALPIPGMKSRGVASLRTLQDAEKILEGCSGAETVAIIGGGFIGLKLACHLKEHHLSVRVFEKEPRLAARMFDRKASLRVEEKLRAEGISVEVDVEVAEVLSEKGWVSGVHLKDGRTIPCQRIIEAVGVRPNIEFLIGSQITLRGGIPVNGRMETNVSGVYAAGDVTMTLDPITSDWINNATWPAATRQGNVAGSNMAGGDRTYMHNFTLNALNLSGFQVMAAGHAYCEEGADIEVLQDEQKESYRKIVLKGGRVIGFILVGDPSNAGYLLSLMKRKETLSSDSIRCLISPHARPHPLPPNLGYGHGLIFQTKGER